ncbi:hypothetical protein [Streptomyces sp.]|uniref:hypothetical protein n=1 Tax=Streptomyces sp. TaxID=1931 RepID=UPI002F91F038
MAWTSKLPGAVDGLVRIFKAWPGLTDATVLDGPTTSQATLTDVVAVGFTGGDEGTDGESTLLTEGLGGGVDREQFSIRCTAVCLRGTDDLPGARSRAYQLLSEAGAAIAADRTLGGTVMRAMIGSHSLSQGFTQSGAQATVTFEVACDAYSGV